VKDDFLAPLRQGGGYTTENETLEGESTITLMRLP